MKFQDKNRHRTIEFLDTYNYFKYSVEKMGQSLGLKKQIDDYSLSPNKWNIKLKDGMGKERVKLDTEILYKYFMRFINNDKFVIGLSLASTSFKTYRKKYQKYSCFIPLKKSILKNSCLSYPLYPKRKASVSDAIIKPKLLACADGLIIVVSNGIRNHLYWHNP